MGSRSRPALAILFAALGSTLSTPASAVDGATAGSEFQVNSYTEDSQTGPSVASDAAGNFVAVWESSFQDGFGSGVFGQRFSSGGTKLGAEFQVNSYTSNAQRFAAVASDTAGNFVVVWSSYGQDLDAYGIFGQRFAGNGTPLGSEFQVNTVTAEAQNRSAVARDGAGSFLVVWGSGQQDGDDAGVFGQLFDGGGAPVGGEFQVNTFTPFAQDYPAAAVDMMGNFVVVWQSFSQDGQSYGIFGQRFASAGAAIGSEFQINTYFTGTQVSAAVASDGAGDFVVAWQGASQDGSASGVFAQRFANDGNPVGTEFQVNTYTEEAQGRPAIFSDKAGGFVVAWESSNDQDGSSLGVFAQRFAPSGARNGGEFQINTYTPYVQFGPSIGGAPAGQFIVVWASRDQDASGDAIFAQRFAQPGGFQAAPALSHGLLLAMGGALAALGWQRLRRHQKPDRNVPPA